MARKKRDEIDWRERVRASVDALPESRASGGLKLIVDFLPSGYSALREAAKRRRMSRAAYVRRAVYAMVAYDLGLPVTDLLQRDPRVARETGLGISDPDGTKFGSWQIESMAGQEES